MRDLKNSPKALSSRFAAFDSSMKSVSFKSTVTRLVFFSPAMSDGLCFGWPARRAKEDVRMVELHLRGDAAREPVLDSLHTSLGLVKAEHRGNLSGSTE